ncbi:restriction endonuclease subunit S [Sphingobacterium mizutaii]|uniref:restriction endonuclease subunit S n=1 Tax=Sphingobacterium mizutaii TaxID=1010 RepID=UPI00162A3260|nr:restriction endonuclease subunit S [Sphingobacterium mizutaii]
MNNPTAISSEMVKKRFKLLPFRDIVLWDVKRYASEKITSIFPIVKLGLHIVEQNQKEKLFDSPEKEFGILGISNKFGVFDAYKEMGANINQAYKKMEEGWLAYNPYRVNVGSIGVKTAAQKFQYISPAYVVFSCQNELLPDYLFKLFKTSRFNKIINERTTGSVRQNLTFDVLKTFDIPLPTINQQEKLLNSYYQKTEKASEQDKLAVDKEKEIESFLLDTLGVKIEKPIKRKGISFIKFSKIERWAADYLFNAQSISGITKANFPALRVKSFLKSYQYGLSLKASEIPNGIPMLRMNNVNNSELDIEDLKYIVLNEEEKKNVILNKGDLLFNRTNSKELVGKTAVFELDQEFTFASYLIRLKLDTKKVNVHFINYLFNSQIGRTQIDLVSRQVSGQANVNAQELQEFIFPIPDLAIQNKIVGEISKLKEEVNSLRLKAEMNRKEALNSFEKAVFIK